MSANTCRSATATGHDITMLLLLLLANRSANTADRYVTQCIDAGAPNISTALIEALGARKHNVSGLLAWADGEPIGLRWGEVIPLSFLADYINQSGMHLSTMLFLLFYQCCLYC